MKNLKFLAPIFTVGFVLLFSFILVMNALIFGYLLKDVGIVWWIIIQQLSVVLGYMWARNLKEPDSLLWFAKKWWVDE